MKKFFSLNSIKLREKKNASNLFQRNGENKRLSTSSLASRQSFFNIEVIREGYNVDISRVDETFTKLHRACLLNYNEKKVLKYINKQPLSINEIDNVANCSPLHLCVVNNNLSLLKILLEHGGDINLKDGNGKTLLIKAIDCKNDLMIQFLINNNADVNRSDFKFNNTPLHWAIVIPNFKAISTLLNCTNINVNLVNDDKETPLHFIAKSTQNLHIFISDCVDNNGLNLDFQDEEGRTPLFVACSNGNYDCAETLVKLNADVSIRNNLNESAYEIAKKNGFVDIVKLLEDNEEKLKMWKTKSLSAINFKNSPIEEKKEDEDSWPETDSEKSLLNKKFKINLNNKIETKAEDQTSFSSFKKNDNTSLSSFSSNDLPLNSTKKKIIKDENKLSYSEDNNLNKNELSNLTSIKKKNEIPYNENDEFIKQMKLAIDEEIDLNEELDEVLFSSNQKIEKIIDPNKNNYKIYLSDDEEFTEDNYSLVKKVKFDSENKNLKNENKFENNQVKSDFIYGLSDEDETEKTLPTNKFKINDNQDDEAKNDLSSSSSKSLKESLIVNKFDDLMSKIDTYEKKNNFLSNELHNAKEQEMKLKLLNQQLKLEFENQKLQINSLEERLKQSDENYSLIKNESEQFKKEFKVEREKFVKFIQEEYKQTEEHLLTLLNNKQETCDYLTNELNSIKENYKKKELEKLVDTNETEIIEKNYYKTIDEETFNNFLNQNEKLNQNFNLIESFFKKQNSLNDSISNLNDVLSKIENQLSLKFSQINNQLINQKDDITSLIDLNFSQNIQSFFKSELESRVHQIKDLIDSLKVKLLSFMKINKTQNCTENQVNYEKLVNQFVDLMDQKFLIERNFPKKIEKTYSENSSDENKKSLKETKNFKPSLNKNYKKPDKNEKNYFVAENKKFKSLNNLDDKDNESTSLYDYNENQSDIEQDDESNFRKENIYTNKNYFRINQYKSSLLNSLANNYEISDKDTPKKFKKVKKFQLKTNLLKNTNRYIKNHLNSSMRNRYQNQINDSPKKLPINRFQKLKHSKIYTKNNISSCKSLIDLYSEDKNFKFNSNNNETSFLDLNFKKRRQILEQDISKLKIELGLLNENYDLKSSSLWNL